MPLTQHQSLLAITPSNSLDLEPAYGIIMGGIGSSTGLTERLEVTDPLPLFTKHFFSHYFLLLAPSSANYQCDIKTPSRWWFRNISCVILCNIGSVCMCVNKVLFLLLLNLSPSYHRVRISISRRISRMSPKIFPTGLQIYYTQIPLTSSGSSPSKLRNAYSHEPAVWYLFTVWLMVGERHGRTMVLRWWLC